MNEKNKKLRQMELDLSQTIAEINLKNFNYREQYLEEYKNCLLCGTELVYHHNTDFIYQTVEEQALCPHCKIPTKKHEHKLQ